MTPEAETERLLLKPIALADAEQIQVIFPRWEIVQYLHTRVPWPYPEDGARQFIEQVTLPAVERGDAWNWTLRLKTEPEMIVGNLELRKSKTDNRGFWLCPEWRRQGLMSEACAWASDFWFSTLGFAVLRVSKAAENRPSRRISERQGMRLIGMTDKDHVCGRLPSEMWEITAEEWQAWKASRSASPVR